MTPKPKRSPETVVCAQCGNPVAETDAVYGQRFLTVEAEWRSQTLCQSCAGKLPPDQYRWSK